MSIYAKKRKRPMSDNDIALLKEWDAFLHRYYMRDQPSSLEYCCFTANREHFCRNRPAHLYAITEPVEPYFVRFIVTCSKHWIQGGWTERGVARHLLLIPYNLPHLSQLPNRGIIQYGLGGGIGRWVKGTKR